MNKYFWIVGRILQGSAVPAPLRLLQVLEKGGGQQMGQPSNRVWQRVVDRLPGTGIDIALKRSELLAFLLLLKRVNATYC